MRIDERYLEELTSKIDIVDIVSRYVPINRRGQNHVGLCPFHSEKTPSFSVSQEKQIFKCFGCGAGGGVISFVMRAENLDFADAIVLLAKEAGMPPPERGELDRGEKRRRERTLAANREAARFFYDQLKTEGGRRAAEYIHKRMLSPVTVNRFGLGFAPDSWSALLDHLAAKGFEKLEILDAGLAVKAASGRVHDRFRNRLIFPIIDVRGDVIAFGGRVLDDSLPKYLNSPDTPVFKKTNSLFAINIAKKNIGKRLILAEGYMDVIALHQAGFDNAVASLGTALTADQARLMKRYAEEVVIAYDADGAGQNAAQRAIGILGAAGLSVKVLRIPGAKDPDEFIKANGAESFRMLLERSENHTEYRLLSIKGKYDLGQDEQRVAFLKEAAAMLAIVDNRVEREVYAARAAEAAGVSMDAVLLEAKHAAEALKKSEYRKQHRKDTSPVASVQPVIKALRYENPRCAVAEEGIISLLTENPELFSHISGRIKAEDFTSPHLGRLFTVICDRIKEKKSLRADMLSLSLEREELELYTSLLSRGGGHPEPERELGDCILVVLKEKAKLGTDGQDPLISLIERKRAQK